MVRLSDALYINGRFAAQGMTGVQRFATEMTRALLQVYPGQLNILTPPGASEIFDCSRAVGTRKGHFWEQIELPRYTNDGILINLGNTAPIFARRQIVVIHDAGVFRTPGAYSKRFRLWYKLLQKSLARGQSRIVTVSDFSRSELVEKLNLPEKRISVVPEGTDHMNRISFDYATLSRHGLKSGNFVLAVGTLARHKNLGALNILAQNLADRGAVLAVTGAFGADAFSTQSPTRLPERARYLGRVSDEDLKALYSNAACFIFPSHYEGFGLPAVEAMACGCAVVAANIPSLRETCADAAIYCDPNSPHDIAQSVINLLDNAPLLQEYRRRAIAHVTSMTWERAAMQFAKVIDQII